MRLRNAGFVAGFLVAVLLGLALTVRPQPAMAQINTVNLSGTVTDPQGLGRRRREGDGCKLRHRRRRTTTADGAGQYRILGLPPGSYTLTVEATGFAKLVSENLVLTLGVAAEFNPQLSLKATTETVTVTGEAEVVETTKTDVSRPSRIRKSTICPSIAATTSHFALLTPQSAPRRHSLHRRRAH